MKKTQLTIILIILISFAVGFYFYPKMPEMMASHWNRQGEVNGYMSKCSSLFFMPFMSLFMFLLFILIPKIDPLKANIEKFRKYYDCFILLVILFLFYIYLLTIFWNLGYRFNMGQLMVPAMALLFYYAGILIENAKKNWFIGIRTPWTLSSDSVWDKTHKIGGKLFKINGLIALLGFFFPKRAFCIVIIPILLFSLYLVLYSYFEYQKELTKKS
jgi:uncharacterized membrane protein